LQEKLNQASLDMLDYARQIGELLLTVDEEQRHVILRAAGVKIRSGQDYARIARFWIQVAPVMAQHQAPSIRAALAVIRKAAPERPAAAGSWPFFWPTWSEIYLASWRPYPNPAGTADERRRGS
jgi:hypothetical protein